MDMVNKIAMAGGLFAVMAFVHFFVDWIFQSHAEAMVKHNNPRVRAKHCLIYTLGFVPLMCLLNYSFWEWLIALNILFWSHFYLDTYHGVFLWAKYIRRPPQMSWRVKLVGGVGKLWNPAGNFLDHVIPSNQWRWDLAVSVPEKSTLKKSQQELDKRGFVEFITETLGKILMIVIDQISHLSFLWILVYFALRHMNK